MSVTFSSESVYGAFSIPIVRERIIIMRRIKGYKERQS